MSIPAHLEGRYAYHFTMINNLESIIEHGLLSTNKKIEKDITHKDVAEKSIQSRRQTMSVLCSEGKVVHDYIPFYFSKRNAMQLSIINKKNIDQPFLIYFAIPIEIIEKRAGVIFSDSSANANEPPNFYDSSETDKLDSLNWASINSLGWKDPSDVCRRQKMAELLVPDILNISDIDHIIVFNESIKTLIEEKIFTPKRISPPTIKVDGKHYYTNYLGNNKSIITGPFFLKQEYLKTVEYICQSTSKTTKFTKIQDALTAISYNFNTIKELNDINGLKANYGPHTDDVGTHSRKVANTLTRFSQYNTLNEYDKNIVKLSAYLHDIGKGPKSRWTNETMNEADNDHAVKSLPMLKRILTEDISNLGAETVRKIVMLVTYDDLVGDIVAKGRDRTQLLDIITSENDVDMLFALGQADMFSISPWWLIERENELVDLYDYAIESLHPNN